MGIAQDIFEGSGGYGHKRDWSIHPDVPVSRRWANKYESRHTFRDGSVLVFSLYPAFLIRAYGGS